MKIKKSTYDQMFVDMRSVFIALPPDHQAQIRGLALEDYDNNFNRIGWYIWRKVFKMKVQNQRERLSNREYYATLYPDESNDDHMRTAFKRLVKAVLHINC